MSLLLVRHGETVMNASRILQVEATPLGPRGQEQVAALAARLREQTIAAVVSSDLPRAWQSAEPIARACGVPLQAEVLLQERNYGRLRGRAYDSLGFDPLTMAAAPPGGESALVFKARVAQAFRRIVQLAAGLSGDLVVVTHGLVIRQMLAGCVGLPEDRMPTRIANTGVTSLAAAPPHNVECLDDTRHLAAGRADDAGGLSGG